MSKLNLNHRIFINWKSQIQNDVPKLSLIELFKNSVKAVTAIGSSYLFLIDRTCTLLSINKELRRVESLNMGDSDYVIYRRIEKSIEEIYHSESLQYCFNFPYQVGTNGDNPLKAHCEIHTLNPGDVIIVASDGLWDNLERDYIKGITEGFLNIKNNRHGLNELSEILANEALKIANSK